MSFRLTSVLWLLIAAIFIGSAFGSNTILSSNAYSGNSIPVTTSTQNTTNLTIVHVGLYLLNIGDFDVSTGTYTMDFYMDMICNRPCNPSTFEFINGHVINKTLSINTSTEQFYRIQADMYTNVNLTDYPLDSHTLPIIMEDQERTNKTYIFVANQTESGVDPNVTLVGYELEGWNAIVVNHYYTVYNQTYSRYIFTANIQRDYLSSVLKTFLPVIFILIVAFISLLIEREKELSKRIDISTAALIAAVLFHVAITSGLPAVDYLTLVDQFMIIAYTALALTILSGVLLWIKGDKGRVIFRVSLYGIPAFTIIAYLLLFLFKLGYI